MKQQITKWIILLLIGLLCLAGCSAASGGNAVQEREADHSNYSAPGSDGELFEIAVDDGRKIVWTGSVTMETTDWDQTMAGLKTLFTENGAEVMSAEEYGGTRIGADSKKTINARSAVYVLRVPSENFSTFLDGFSKVDGSVLSSNKSRADMTKRYDENALELTLLQAEYDDLKTLLDSAKDLNEIMLIRDRMTEVMKEIQLIETENNRIDYDVSYSKVTFTIREVLIYSDPGKNENWFVRFGEGFVSGAKSFFNFIGNFFIWFGEYLFFILLFGGVFVVLPIILIRKGVRKARRKALKQAKKQAEAQVEDPEKK